MLSKLLKLSPSRQQQRSFTTAVLIAMAPIVLAEKTATIKAPKNFEQCKIQLQEKAIAQGVSAKTAKTVMANVQFVPRVIELDRKQPEFTTTFSDYLNRRVNDARVEKGRKLIKQHHALLAEVSEKTGVPAPYLVAFWGLETNFGSYLGKMSVPNSLTTLACDERRSTFFTKQLIAALQIIDEGAIAVEKMEGSWAGAMGHVQFMPTVFLKHAVDGDNDGKRDLWNSVPDAMLSAGKFLQSMGWNGDYRWGREVLLPQNFDYALADGRRLTLANWDKLGIVDAFGKALAKTDIKAALIVPAGHQGPAFLAYDNFKVIMGWNRSEYYAIAVGHLADRIAGAGKLQNPPPENAPTLSRETIMKLQQALNNQGFDAGEPDGIVGPASREAIRNYQSSNKMIADGYPSHELLKALKLSQ